MTLESGMVLRFSMALQNKIVMNTISRYVYGETSLFKTFKLPRLLDVIRLCFCMCMLKVLYLNLHSTLRRDFNVKVFNNANNTRGSDVALMPATRTEVFMIKT